MLDDLDGLITELQSRYDVGEGFARAYVRYKFNGRPHLQCSSLDDIMALPSPEPMWFDYAMSTNWRGGELARLLAPHMPVGARRYLDIGCGFGGCLVAMSRLGLEVQGVEIDPIRVELAVANCADNGLHSCAHQRDILADGAIDDLGTFDIITLVDVIEHVLDVPGTLTRVARLLNPGGIAFLEIPNKFDLQAVAHDGHFDLFGITLLPRPLAIEYHRTFFAFDYDVGDYYETDYYMGLLKKLGCTTTVISSLHHQAHDLEQAAPLHKAMLEAYATYREQTASQVSTPVDQAIRQALEVYEEQYNNALASVSVSDDPSIDQRRAAFQLKYLTDFWTLLAVKANGV